MEDEKSGGLRQQISAVASAPLLCAVAVLVIAAVIWGILQVSYRAVLANKDRHIALLERRVADYRNVAGGATPDEARRRTEAMETELRTLRLRLQPRRVTPEQRQAIIDRSQLPAGAPARAVTVISEENCSDCAAFAAGLVEALRASHGWNLNTSNVANLPDSRAGLAIRVPDRLRPPPEAMVLQHALRSAGLEFTMLGGATGPNVELLVTERAPQ